MDTLSPAQRSERMARVRSKDTKPERAVRRLAHALGYRYRLHQAYLPGRPDLVFPGRHKVVFVHGCFWHRHESATCKLARLPKSKSDFWLIKLEGNRLRDRRNLQALRKMGWKALVVWECQLRDHARLSNRLIKFLDECS